MDICCVTLHILQINNATGLVTVLIFDVFFFFPFIPRHMGVRTESWTMKRSGLEVRMYSREKVELFLLATEDGMGPTAAAKFAGVSVVAAS